MTAESQPKLEEYLKTIYEQADPAEGIEEQYKVVNDKAFTWRALRLIKAHDVTLLSKVAAPGGTLEKAVVEYFENLKSGASKKDDEPDKMIVDAELPDDPEKVDESAEQQADDKEAKTEDVQVKKDAEAEEKTGETKDAGKA